MTSTPNLTPNQEHWNFAPHRRCHERPDGPRVGVLADVLVEVAVRVEMQPRTGQRASLCSQSRRETVCGVSIAA